jgi:hypothetical protein
MKQIVRWMYGLGSGASRRAWERLYVCCLVSFFYGCMARFSENFLLITSFSPDQLWVNPDCGLKTRNWPETKAALVAMVDAAKELRKAVNEPVS